MSNSTALGAVCLPERAELLDAKACCARTQPTNDSPIDIYIEHQRHVLVLGAGDALENSKTLARLLILGLVTGVESYFRGVLAASLRICPDARNAATEQVIPFGSLGYYGPDEIELALFEGTSFTSVKEIRNRTQKVLDVAVPTSGSTSEALERYGLVCQLRHAAVHAHGALTSGNAHALGLPASLTPSEVHLTVAGLQDLASICLSAVRAYNRFLFEALLNRWIKNGRLTGYWRDDWRSFRALHRAFYSTLDGAGDADARKAFEPVSNRLLGRQ